MISLFALSPFDIERKCGKIDKSYYKCYIGDEVLIECAVGANGGRYEVFKKG